VAGNRAPGLFDTIEEKKAESGHVNRIRQLVKGWRDLGWPDATPATRALLEHWLAEDRFRPLFFCQVEALETLIFITEVAKQTKYGHDWIEKYLREKADDAGTYLFRIACKMATGSGKTVVMSMLIAWHVVNKAVTRKTSDSRMPSSSSRLALPSAIGCGSCCHPIPTTTTRNSTSFPWNIAATLAPRRSPS
jgi:hypothetical protein